MAGRSPKSGKQRKHLQIRPSPFCLACPLDEIPQARTEFEHQKAPSSSHRQIPLASMATATESSPKYVVFFDIDNTLYPASASISALMVEKIRGRSNIPPNVTTLTGTATSVFYWHGNDTGRGRSAPYTLLPGIRSRHSRTHQTPPNRCTTFPSNSISADYPDYMNVVPPIPRRPRFRREM